MTSGLLIAVVALCVATVAHAQPAPPRLHIPGAIPLGAFPVPEQHFRTDRVLPPPSQQNGPAIHRVRRPQQSLKALAALHNAPVAAAPAPPPPQLPNYPSVQPAFAAAADARPVNEENDDETFQQPAFIPPNFQQHIQQQEQHLTESLTRAQQQQQNLDSLNIGGGNNGGGAGGRFAFAQDRQQVERQQPQQQQQQQQQPRLAAVVRRPAFREASPAQPQYEPAPQQQQPTRRVQPQPAQPAKQYFASSGDAQRPRNSQEAQRQQQEEREVRPVAQIVRKYREENEDGSITWGYENDDGSYKEEFIGVDCVTRGRYGYVDPDGMKREYTYETGIACDPNKKNSEEDEIADGYIDYQNQEMVLANGDRIDLGGIGKNKARRPAAAGGYRN